MSDHYSDAHRDMMGHRRKEQNRTARDIGEIPPIKDPARRARCERDLRAFCETYHSGIFYHGWSKDHLKAIELVEESTLNGGLFALAMPRGQGKTCIAEAAALWAVLYGHRSYVFVIGANDKGAMKILDTIKMACEMRRDLIDDFPAALFPVAALERVAQRANGQTYNGEPTRIVWKGDSVVMPTIPGSECSGSIIQCAGITSAIRGAHYATPDGRVLRPDLVIIDDPQTNESARSRTQCDERERVLSGAVLGLAGPGKKIAGIMPCTVICEGDMAHRMLDRTLHPEWQGRTTSLMLSMPRNMTKDDAKRNGAKASWEEYDNVRIDSLQAEEGISRATKYYVENREDLDDGAAVSWEDRFNEDEASAIQNAMNIYFSNKEAFFSEYQNAPLPRDNITAALKVEDVAARKNGHKRHLVPAWAHTVTGMIDVQGEALFYVITAWGDGMTGAVIDYGVFPEQSRRQFTLTSLKRTLSQETGIDSLDGRLYRGLEMLVNNLATRRFPGDDDSEHVLSRLLIDANWGASTDVVYQFCRQSKHSPLLTPSHGRGVTASGQPLNAKKRAKGEKMGHYWRMPPSKGSRGHVRHVLYDTNYWKTLTSNALAAPIGQRGAISLYEEDVRHHLTLAEHVTAEYSVRTAGRGREVDEWKIRPGNPDNHWLDCLVGSAVAASMEGVATHRAAPITTAPRQQRRAPMHRPHRADQPQPSQSPRPPRGGGGFMDGFNF